MPGDWVRVAKLPKCDLHPDRDALYDFATRRDSEGGGRWMNGCPDCFRRLGYKRLGTGLGQRLVLDN